jgi:hypothetical protein
MDFVVPDGWELPVFNIICLCRGCGFIYYDNDRTQTDYDAFYKNRYDYWDLKTDLNHHRLDELVKLTCKIEQDKEAVIVDFGGGSESYIVNRLKEHGYTNVESVNVGDALPDFVNLIIASHVIEHIYDLRRIMDWLMESTPDKFLIEIPDAKNEIKAKNPLLDYMQLHVNHFTSHLLDKLFDQYGYSPTYEKHFKSKSHKSYNYRVVYEMVGNSLYYDSKDRVTSHINRMVKALKHIDFPVIVWGCGDTCLHLLAQVNLNIVHFVDMDKCWKGQTIQGIPVLDHVESNAPILILAWQAKDLIKKQIFEQHIFNNVLTI